jgi:hypothetical protein
VIDDFPKSCGIEIKLALEADNLAMPMSLIASTGTSLCCPHMYNL